MDKTYRYKLDLEHAPTGKQWSTTGRARATEHRSAADTAVHSGRIKIRNQMAQAGMQDKDTRGPFTLIHLVMDLEKEETQ